MIDSGELATRYVAAWNEPDPQRRRDMVRGLWAADGAQVLEPPQEIRDAGAALGMTARLEAHGHDELEDRVARAYDDFVAPGEFTFRSRGNTARLGDLVKFNWEMVRADDGEVAAVGLEILQLDHDGQIRLDYQFIER
jgi:hypothetical protein